MKRQDLHLAAAVGLVWPSGRFEVHSPGRRTVDRVSPGAEIEAARITAQLHHGCMVDSLAIFEFRRGELVARV